MTTTVKISSANPNHQNVVVKTLHGGSVVNQVVLTDGEETTQYVYEGQTLLIEEVAKPAAE